MGELAFHRRPLESVNTPATPHPPRNAPLPFGPEPEQKFGKTNLKRLGLPHRELRQTLCPQRGSKILTKLRVIQ